MFAEWSDPFDIDNYYDEVGNIFTKVSAYMDPSKLSKTGSAPTVVSPQTPNAIDSAPNKVGVVEMPPPIEKSNFEVQPNSIYLDGHPVGSQPVYNILRSGPPVKETYMNPCYARESRYGSYDMTHILNMILFIIIFMMIVNIIKLTKTINKQNRCIINLLSYLKK